MVLVGVSSIVSPKRVARRLGNRALVPRAWRNDGSPVLVTIFGIAFVCIGMIAITASLVGAWLTSQH